jgi:flagellar biosynthetic protein FlhB
MSGEEDGAEKSFEPTQKKLDDARKRGEIARSTDLHAAAALLGLLLAFLGAGPGMVRGAGAALSFGLEAPGQAGAAAMTGRVLLALSPAFALPALLVLGSLVAQRALVVAPDKLMPKLSRISPVSVAKNKFGRSGLFDFAKSTVKLALVGLIVVSYLMAQRDVLIGSLAADPAQVGPILAQLLTGFLLVIVVLTGAIGAVDYLWQAAEHRRRLMMTRKDMTDEAKESEGDPHLKQARRQRGYDIATNRMLDDVPRADVVVVNPTHFAVALKWSRASGGAPVCVAKGTDEIAARIRERAAAAGVPIHRDPPTARALHATVGLGEEIRPEHYKAVAAAIRFAEKIRAAAREQQR